MAFTRIHWIGGFRVEIGRQENGWWTWSVIDHPLRGGTFQTRADAVKNATVELRG